MTALREVFARFGVQFDPENAVGRGDAAVGGLTERLQGLGAALGAAAIVAGVRAFATSIAAVGDEIDKTSRVIGISTTDLQEWRHAATISGVGAEEFSSNLVRLQRGAGDAVRTGTGPMFDAFRRLDVSLTDSNGNLRDASDLLMDMADPIQALASDTERVAILNNIMGRSGARMGVLFEGGAAGIRALRGEVSALGGGMSAEAVAAAAEYTDAIARMDLAMLSVKSRISVFLLPALQRLIDASTRTTAAFAHLAQRGRLLETIFVALGVAAVAAGRKAIVTWIRAAAPFVALAVVAGVAILVFEDLWVGLEGGESQIAALGESIAAFSRMHSGESSAMGIVTRTWEYLAGVINSVVDTVREFLGLDPLPAAHDIVRDAASPEEAELAQRILTRNQASAGGLADALAPDDFERALALSQAGAALRSGAVDEDTRERLRRAGGRRGADAAKNTVNNVSVTARTDANPREIAREVGRVLDRQNAETEDALTQSGSPELGLE